MAAPTAPTQTTIINTFLGLAGHESPDATLIALAATWLELMKNELAIMVPTGKMKSLFTQSVLVLAQGKEKYAMPTNASFYGDKAMQLISGSTTGTATGGSTSTIVLQAGQTVTLGEKILITSGDAQGSLSQATSLTDQTATVEPNFAEAVVNGNTYMIIDTYDPLERRDIGLYAIESTPTIQGKPEIYYPYEDADNGELIIKPTPDGVYGIPYMFYENLSTLDLTGTKIATLYNKWYSWWIQGGKTYALENDDDDRAVAERAYFREMTKALVLQEMVGSN
jgi:hypothetical protein